MNTKHFVLLLTAFAFAFVIAGFAGATTTLSASYPSTALHNTDVTITFNLSYVGAKDVTTYNFSASSINIGSWKTLPSLTDIANSSQLTLTAVINVPEHQSGTISAHLYADDMNSTSYDDELISISINNTASMNLASTQSITKTHNGSITIENTGNTALTNIVLSASGDLNVTFSSNNIALSAGDSETVNVLTNEDLGDLGAFDVTILANDSSAGAHDTLDLEASADFCEYGNVNASNIKITDITDSSSDSEDEWEWTPLQNVEIEVDVENNLDDDEDFIIELALYDTEDHEYMDLDGEETLEEDVSIDEDDSETVTFEFTLPADMKDSDGRYVLFVKAYVDGDEEKYCNSYEADDVPSSDVDSIKIDLNTNDVVLDDISVSPELVVTAGDTVTVSARAYNVGKEDEAKVKVGLTNSKLGLNLESSSFDLDIGDSQSVDFSFVVPTTAENGVYSLKMDTYFDYKKSSDVYQKESTETWEVKITVAGGAPSTNVTKPQAAAASITASLSGEANAGSEMIVTTTIKNTGSSKTTFAVGASGYSSWATLKSISNNSITLNAGESRDVALVFEVDNEAEGEQTFTLEVKDGAKLSSKEVAVTIEKKSGSFSSWLSGLFANKTLLWIVGAINLVLIVLIIILAVRMLKR